MSKTENIMSKRDRKKKTNKKEKSRNMFNNILDYIIKHQLLMVIIMILIAYYTYQQNRISEKTTEIADQTLKISNRAYVHIVEFSNNKVDDINDLEISYRIENTGNTPAYNVLIYSDFSIREKEPEKIHTVDLSEPRDGNIIAGRGAAKTLLVNFRQKFGRSINEEELAKIKNGSFLYFLGVITYIDIFDKKHCIKFCAYYDIERKIISRCLTGNEQCTDDEYPITKPN